VLTGICLLGILVSVVDFAVPTLNSYLFSSSEWYVRSAVLLAVSALLKSSCHSLLQKQLKNIVICHRFSCPLANHISVIDKSVECKRL